MRMPLPPLQERPRAWVAEVDGEERCGPAGVPIPAFNKRRLARQGQVTLTGYGLHGHQVKSFTCKAHNLAGGGGGGVSLLLPIPPMRKRRLRELQGVQATRQEAWRRQHKATVSHWRASWAQRVGLGSRRKCRCGEGHSGPREQQEQRQCGMKGQGGRKEWQGVEGGRTQGSGDIRGCPLGTGAPAPATGK